jgi:hypothetical protein
LALRYAAEPPDEVGAALLRTDETSIDLSGDTANRNGLVVRVRLDLPGDTTGRTLSKNELRRSARHATLERSGSLKRRYIMVESGFRIGPED